jgi:dephospho-CoA kinase
VAPLADIVPSAIVDGAVDRRQLAARVQKTRNSSEGRAIVHPLVKARQLEFLSQCLADGAPLAVLDIPLLFETGRDKDVDKISSSRSGSDPERSVR